MKANTSSIHTVLETLRAIGKSTGRAVGAMFTDSRHRATIRQLSALDDWVLKDIGIERSEIPAAVMGLHRERPPSSAVHPAIGGAQGSLCFSANDNRGAQAA